MKFHPYSEIFPLIEGVELDSLIEDIKAYGLREKIWLFEGKILDGRNRFLACKKADVKPLYRKFTGKDALAFVVSANIQRRHLTIEQRAFAAARIANMRQGERTDLASGEARSQTDAAEDLGVSRSSLQRAKKVLDQGSKALLTATESGEVGLAKAAAVVDLPKSEQLKAATQKPVAQPEPESSEPERPEDDPDEDEKLAAMERELNSSMEKVMRSDDKLSGSYDEIKRLTAELAVVKISRDGYMNGKTTMTNLLKAEQRKTAKQTKRIAELEKENTKLREQLDALRERVAIMEAQ